jgi:hypothetical protein
MKEYTTKGVGLPCYLNSNSGLQDVSLTVLPNSKVVLRSYKASRNLTRFAGMVKTHPRTFHVGVDPSHVHSLVTRLTAQYSVAILDGGCDTGLLGDGWYILDYFG